MTTDPHPDERKLEGSIMPASQQASKPASQQASRPASQQTKKTSIHHWLDIYGKRAEQATYPHIKNAAPFTSNPALSTQ